MKKDLRHGNMTIDNNDIQCLQMFSTHYWVQGSGKGTELDIELPILVLPLINCDLDNVSEPLYASTFFSVKWV